MKEPVKRTGPTITPVPEPMEKSDQVRGTKESPAHIPAIESKLQLASTNFCEDSKADGTLQLLGSSFVCSTMLCGCISDLPVTSSALD